MYEDDIFYGAPPEIFKRARELRRNQTNTEKLLWNKIRNRQLKGYKFRRQHPLSIYIVDFYCHEARLIVELDGPIHELKGNKDNDKERTRRLNLLGLEVMRFRNEEVEININEVLRKIGAFLPNPSPNGEGNWPGVSE